MNHSLQSIAQRREKLITDIATQRVNIAQDIDALRKPFAIADQGLAAVQYIKTNPFWLVSAGALLVTLLRPKRAGKWLQGGVMAWKILRKLRSRTQKTAIKNH